MVSYPAPEYWGTENVQRKPWPAENCAVSSSYPLPPNVSKKQGQVSEIQSRLLCTTAYVWQWVDERAIRKVVFSWLFTKLHIGRPDNFLILKTVPKKHSYFLHQERMVRVN